MKRIILVLASVLCMLSGCSEAKEQDLTEEEKTSGMFTDRDMEVGYDAETSTYISLLGDSASCDDETVTIDGSTITITDEGTYVVTGELQDGTIVIAADDQDKIQVVLDNAEISSSTSAAVYVQEADKVFITTARDSENRLANEGNYTASEDDNIDAVIFSASDLTLNGEGSLTIDTEAGHGIVSKDDLILTSGDYTITSEKQGLSGKDSVRIANGTYSISSGTDAIHAENSDDEDLGFLYIEGGDFTIVSEGDGMSASSYVQIKDGSFDIVTGEGSAGVEKSQGDFWQHDPFAGSSSASQESDEVSMKGIKAATSLTITQGSFVIDAEDDAIHANGDITISDGQFELKSGDDGIHADATLIIEDGQFTISDCYEGIEGLTVSISDGEFTITSTDDGINAAGGVDSSGYGERQQDSFSQSSDIYVEITGGSFVIVSQGDCIDSNGSLIISGGTLDLTCNGNGNTAIDCDGDYSFEGSDITTNDGSQNDPGQMGGGMKGQEGRMQFDK